jgi:uncharacterized membrane protein YfcA
LFLLSLIAAFLDAAIGIGYGTLLTPLLILLNLPPFEVISAVLLAQIIAAIITALSYHLHGNVNFTATSDDTKIAFILSIAGILGAILAVTIFLNFFIAHPDLLQIYIGIAFILIGIMVLTKITWRITTGRIFTIGLIAALNKGISAGGYTPIVAGGQMLHGRNGKQAIGTSMVSETFTSLTAVLLYITFGHLILDPLFIQLALPLVLSTFIATPLASYFVKRTPIHRMTHLIGSTIIILGIFTFIKTLFSGIT